ncbi:MAG: ABC transporter permease subunit [Candidatus Heimdallarchaeota archaeon]|nr:ABC transporter permease subunit [Candidatus Heimdallarchaeota archaeon]
MSMRSYAIRRFIYIFPTLLGISIVSFALIAASPGDPIQIRMGLFKGEQTDYVRRYNEIGVSIGFLQKVGSDEVSFNIHMDTTTGFSLKEFNVTGPETGNIDFTTVTLYLTSDIERNFSITGFGSLGYNIQVLVPGGSEVRSFVFVANKLSTDEHFNTSNNEIYYTLERPFSYTATDISETGTMIVEETRYTRVNAMTRYLQWLGLMKKYLVEDLDGDGTVEREYRRLGILQGNFGRSWHWVEGSADQGKPIMDIIVGRMWYTLFLTTPAFVISTVLATVIGVIQATRQYSIWDKGVTIASLIGYSMPTFWLAKLVMLASFYIFNFTGATTGEAFTEPFILNGTFYVFLILPTITLVLTGLVFLARLTRSQLLDILRQDYITTARAKGLSERSVIYKHAFRNAMLPIITVVGMALPGLLGGAVMTEGVFGWPGLGTVFLTSALQRDHPMMMATNFIFGAMFLAFRLLVDLSYALVDPRIRY